MYKHRDENDNRVKRLVVPEEQVLNCFVINSVLPGDCQVKLSIKGIPPGTLILGSYYDQMWNSHTLILYNSAWPVVARGDTCELLKLEAEVVQVKMDIPHRSMESQPLTQESNVLFPGMTRILPDGTVGYGKPEHQKAFEAELNRTVPLADVKGKDLFNTDWRENEPWVK